MRAGGFLWFLSPGPRTVPASTKIAIGSVVEGMNACAHLEGLDLSWIGYLKTSQVAKGQQHQDLQLPVLVPDSHSVGKAPNLHFLPVSVGS